MISFVLFLIIATVTALGVMESEAVRSQLAAVVRQVDVLKRQSAASQKRSPQSPQTTADALWRRAQVEVDEQIAAARARARGGRYQ
jgi:hypothetical protein